MRRELGRFPWRRWRVLIDWSWEEVRGTELLPFGWGFAYCPYDRMAVVIAPVPINLAIAVCRWAYYGLLWRWIPKARRDVELGRAFAAGYERGRSVGAK